MIIFLPRNALEWDRYAIHISHGFSEPNRRCWNSDSPGTTQSLAGGISSLASSACSDIDADGVKVENLYHIIIETSLLETEVQISLGATLGSSRACRNCGSYIVYCAKRGVARGPLMHRRALSTLSCSLSSAVRLSLFCSSSWARDVRLSGAALSYSFVANVSAVIRL